MTSTHGDAATLDLLVERLVGAPHRALFFDYDGTLAPFAPRPELATLSPAVRDHLAQLAAHPTCSLGIISSRRLDEVFELVGVEGLRYAGLTGLELRDPDGNVRRHEALDAAAPALDAVSTRLEHELERFSGAWIEDKNGALAVHCRDVQTERIADLSARVRAVVERDEDLLRLEVNAFTFEVWPRVDTNKGVALEVFLADVPGDALALYAGDDTNDIPALERVRAAEGLAIGIGPRAPEAATYRLSAPAQVHTLLERLAHELDTLA